MPEEITEPTEGENKGPRRRKKVRIRMKVRQRIKTKTKKKIKKKKWTELSSRATTLILILLGIIFLVCVYYIIVYVNTGVPEE